MNFGFHFNGVHILGRISRIVDSSTFGYNLQNFSFVLHKPWGYFIFMVVFMKFDFRRWPFFTRMLLFRLMIKKDDSVFEDSVSWTCKQFEWKYAGLMVADVMGVRWKPKGFVPETVAGIRRSRGRLQKGNRDTKMPDILMNSVSRLITRPVNPRARHNYCAVGDTSLPSRNDRPVQTSCHFLPIFVFLREVLFDDVSRLW